MILQRLLICSASSMVLAKVLLRQGHSYLDGDGEACESLKG